MLFPELSVRDLEGLSSILPDDLPAGPRVLIVAFQRWHQSLVDTWVPVLEAFERDDPDLSVWEVPALSRTYSLARFYIDGGMRAGIPDPDAREHTLTAYTDLTALAEKLELPNLETIYVFLLATDGEMVWRGEGGATNESVAALCAALATLEKRGEPS